MARVVRVANIPLRVWLWWLGWLEWGFLAGYRVVRVGFERLGLGGCQARWGNTCSSSVVRAEPTPRLLAGAWPGSLAAKPVLTSDVTLMCRLSATIMHVAVHAPC